MLQLDAIYKAAHVLKEVVRRTDLIYAPQINPESTVYLKPENLHDLFSGNRWLKVADVIALFQIFELFAANPEIFQI